MMTVADLIRELEKVEEKDLPVFVYRDYDVIPLEKGCVDSNLEDRVDLNLPFSFERK